MSLPYRKTADVRALVLFASVGDNVWSTLAHSNNQAPQTEGVRMAVNDRMFIL